MSYYTRIRKENTCFKIKVNYFDTHLSLQSQFQALRYFYFLLIIPNLGSIFVRPKAATNLKNSLYYPLAGVQKIKNQEKK